MLQSVCLSVCSSLPQLPCRLPGLCRLQVCPHTDVDPLRSAGGVSSCLADNCFANVNWTAGMVSGQLTKGKFNRSCWVCVCTTYVVHCWDSDVDLCFRCIISQPTVCTTCSVCGSAWSRRCRTWRLLSHTCWRRTLRKSTRRTSCPGWTTSQSFSGLSTCDIFWSFPSCVGQIVATWRQTRFQLKHIEIVRMQFPQLWPAEWLACWTQA